MRGQENSIKSLESNYKKLIADAREHFKQRNIESGKGVAKLKEEDTETLLEPKYEIERVLLEDQKALSELEEKYKRLESKSNQLLLVYNTQVKKWKGEKKQYKKIIQTLQQELELKELELKELELKEQDRSKRELREGKRKEREVKEQELSDEHVRKEQKNSREITSENPQPSPESSLKKETFIIPEQYIKNPAGVKEKSKTTLIDIISTFLIVGANFFFVFVIYPNIANWVDTAGLNDLSLIIRILITLLGVLISLLCILKARKTPLRGDRSPQKRKGTHNLNLLLVIIVVGAALLFVFLFSSNFLFFIVGALLIILAGLIAVIDYGNPRYH